VYDIQMWMSARQEGTTVAGLSAVKTLTVVTRVSVCVIPATVCRLTALV